MSAATFEEGLRYFLNTSSLKVSQTSYSAHTTQRPPTPYMVFTSTAQSPIHSHMGGSNMIQGHYQFSIFDPSQNNSLTIADALRQLLDGLRNVLFTAPPVTPSDIAKTYNVRAVLFKGQHYMFYPDTKLHAQHLDFFFQYYE